MAEFLVRTGNLTRAVTHMPATGELPAKTRARVAVDSPVLGLDGQWRKGHAQFYDVTVTGTRADVAVRTLRVGDPVAFAGHVTAKEYRTADGHTGITQTVKAQFLALDLRATNVTIDRASSDPMNAAKMSDPITTVAGEQEYAPDPDLGF